MAGLERIGSTEPTIPERFEQALALREEIPGGQGIALKGPANLSAWLGEHDRPRKRISELAEEQFRTPIPYPDVMAWREEAGYEYGDSWPGPRFWNLVFAQEERTPHTLIEGSDSLIRLGLLIPRQDDKKTNVRLPLAVHFKRNSDLKLNPGGVNWPELGLRVGSGQISEHGVELDARASQELLLVATRMLLGKTTESNQDKHPRRWFLGKGRTPPPAN